MEFRHWLEQKWFEFKDTVILYHGTSSSLLPIIKKNGLNPPDENLEEYSKRILKLYGVEPTPPLMDWIRTHGTSLRTNTPIHKIGNVIYLTPVFEQAKNYADYTHKYGGELAADIWRAINVIESKKRGLPKMQEIIPPIYKNAEPVVLEVGIPYKWMKTYHNLEERYKNALEYWESHWKTQYPDINDYLEKETGGFEARVEETIPASMIKKIHYVSDEI